MPPGQASTPSVGRRPPRGRCRSPRASPMVTRKPSPANGRTTTPASAQAAEAASRWPRQSASQTNSPRLSGICHPSARKRAADPRALGHGGLDSLEQLGSATGRSEATAAAWAIELTANGTLVMRIASATSGVGDRVADPQAGQPVGLRERAQHCDVGPVAVRPRSPSGTSGSRLNSRYASSSTTRQSLGTASRNRSSSRPADRRPGRIVRVADEHDPGARRDRRGHRVEVVHAAAVSGTGTAVAPATWTMIGYASNERHAKTTSSPGPAKASTSWVATPTGPAADDDVLRRDVAACRPELQPQRTPRGRGSDWCAGPRRRSRRAHWAAADTATRWTTA